MNWIHFLLWVAGIYVFYYLVIIVFDIAFASRSASGQAANTNELTFSPQVQPQKLEHTVSGADRKTKSANNAGVQRNLEPEIVASGGVGLKELFNLARQEVIVYTGQVSY